MRDRLTRMRLQKCIDRRIQIIVGLLGQIAPQPRRDQIVVDGIGLERRGIRRVRQVQANALHGRDEGLSSTLQLIGRPPAATSAAAMPMVRAAAAARRGAAAYGTRSSNSRTSGSDRARFNFKRFCIGIILGARGLQRDSRCNRGGRVVE